MRRFLLYLLRWQLSTPILAIVTGWLAWMGYWPAVAVANLVGAVIFFWVDGWIFRVGVVEDSRASSQGLVRISDTGGDKMGKSQRDKGNRNERQLVHIFRAYGISAQRVPLSGGTSYAKGDVEAEIKGRIWRIESKVRGNGFKRLYEWLTGNDALVVRADRCEALIVLPLRAFCELFSGGAENERDEDAEEERPKDGVLLAESAGS